MAINASNLWVNRCESSLWSSMPSETPAGSSPRTVGSSVLTSVVPSARSTTPPSDFPFLVWDRKKIGN